MGEEVRRSKRLRDKNVSEKKPVEKTPVKTPEKKPIKKKPRNEIPSEKDFFIYLIKNLNKLEEEEVVVEIEINDKDIYGPFLPKINDMGFKHIKFDKIFETLDELISLNSGLHSDQISRSNSDSESKYQHIGEIQLDLKRIKVGGGK